MRTFIALCTLVSAYASSMMVLATSDANAADRRAGAGYCHAGSTSTLVTNTNVLSNPNSGSIAVYCTVPTDSFLSHASVHTLNIHGSSSGTTGNVKACAQDFASTAASCGTMTSLPSGHFNTTVSDLSAWSAIGHAAWFPVVQVSLPPGGSIAGLYLSS